MPKSHTALALPVESRIFVLHDQKVILDSDLAIKELMKPDAVPGRRIGFELPAGEQHPERSRTVLRKAKSAGR